MREESIIRFVRETLSCTCPDEVFQYIECKSDVSVGDNLVLDYEINIGNRLLIYMVAVDEADPINSLLPQLVRIGSGPVNVVPQGVRCARHPDVQAVQYCKSCRVAVCGTCDFALPGGVHVCPDCATKTSEGLSEKRKKPLGWAYGLAVLGTLGTIVFFLAAAGGAFDDP